MSFKKPAAIAVGVVLLLSGVASPQPANLYTFSPAVEITETPPDDGYSVFYSSGQHYTAFRGDTVYVVWGEGRAFTPPTGNHIFFAKSTDKGQTFGPNIRVNSTAAGFNPSMRVDSSGIIYVAYERQGNIFFTKSMDGGNSFTAAIQMVDSAGLPYTQELPSITVNNGRQVFIAWIDYRTNPFSIFTTASYNGGLSFGPNVQASTSGKLGDSPDIAADDSGRVFVVWDSFDPPNKAPTCLSRSDDSGRTFPFRSYVSDLPMDTTDALALTPSLAIGDDGAVGVAWEDIRYDLWTIHFSSSTDYGQTFSPSVRIDDDPDPACCPQPQRPSVVWRNGIFWMTFNGPAPSGYSGIFFTYQTSDSGSFALPADASSADSVLSLRGVSSLAANEKGEAFVAWIDDRYDPDLQLIIHIFGALGKAAPQKGDLNLDGLLTPVDVVLELNAVFAGQPFPAPFEAGDVNCDLELTPPDIVLLLRATFAGDPFPC